MKQDLDRVKSDVETMQKAMGLVPSMAREWVEWLKRDRWFSLWWCLPGLVEIIMASFPINRSVHFWGLAYDQWAGIMTAVALLGVSIPATLRSMGKDGRPAAVARETKRIYGSGPEGLRFALALMLQLVFYFLWANQYHIHREAFWTGIFIIMGSACMVVAISSKVWLLLGFAVPFIAYGLGRPLVEPDSGLDRMLLGIMFVAIGLSFSFIQSLQIRYVQSQHESH